MKNYKFQSMNAVQIDDLNNLLDEYGLLENFSEGKLKCKYCKTVITYENIYSIMRDSGNYKAICNKPECIESLLDKINTSRKTEVDNG